MSGNLEKIGILSNIEFTEKEREAFLEYMAKQSGSDFYDILYGVFGEDWLKFLDVFSGETLKLPTREQVFKNIKYLKIYTYCAQRNFSEESIDQVARIYGKRRVSVKRIIDKVKRVEEKQNGCSEQFSSSGCGEDDSDD